MRRQLEGSRAIAEAVARCRPLVVPAYPITPQTHIVEALGVLAGRGDLGPCQFLTVESEFAAMSAAIGACAAGARSYTATASQGLLYMAEALFNAAGLGLPIVMTVANRAIGAPINIWNDQSDTMSLRDSGWVQLYAEDNQAAVDLHPVAFRLAEQLSVPVMVCVDGFVLTHAVEPIDVPDPAVVDAFLPAFRPRQWLDPADPVTIGAMVGPDAYTEVRWLADQALRASVDVLPRLGHAYGAATGRPLSDVQGFRVGTAPIVLVSLGSVAGTVRDAVADDADIGHLSLTLYRPFPDEAVRAALDGAEHVIVLERALTPGAQGAVTADVQAALLGTGIRVSTAVAGLGGRPVTRETVRSIVADARAGALPGTSVRELHLDLRPRESTTTPAGGRGR